jgi:cyclophilin family peptidyl-prolyl cis-trans isomerase
MKRLLLSLGTLVVIGIGIWLVARTGPSGTLETVQAPVDTHADTNTVASIQTDTTKEPLQADKTTNYMKATLHTTMGDITIEFNESTPKTVENFTKLASSGFYDGTKFHRVIEGFMSQGGDPLSKDDSKSALWGTGGPGYSFADEITASNKNNVGTISMANSGPNTNGSQFFINAASNNFLDGKHTVFGTVVAGMDVATAINQVQTDGNDRPLVPVAITGITLE